MTADLRRRHLRECPRLPDNEGHADSSRRSLGAPFGILAAHVPAVAKMGGGPIAARPEALPVWAPSRLIRHDVLACVLETSGHSRELRDSAEMSTSDPWDSVGVQVPRRQCGRATHARTVRTVSDVAVVVGRELRTRNASLGLVRGVQVRCL